MKKLFSVVFLVGMCIMGLAQSPPELGDVQWLRSYDEALKESSRTGKPVFILFQEVPGCSTCVNYGMNVLSDPLLVDAIENEFVPLAIYNNKGGSDRKTLDLYQEPTWNNPVVRIVDAKGTDLIDRIAGKYSIRGVVDGISSALLVAGKGQPKYLSLLIDLQERRTETTYYSMHCFWTGEAVFGGQDGIIATEPGWMSGKEVVKITYDPNKVSEKELHNIAKRNHFHSTTYDTDYRIDNDPQYYLKQSPYKYLPLSSIQKSRINAELASSGNPNQFLSQTQLQYLKIIKSTDQEPKVLYHLDFNEAWSMMKSEL